ncbi:phage antirepressor [Salipaludibacillus sp. HK11]|uniref:phage antirepressor n=1 Tax=Salipaludibacillus sp. HK11 TaxID=3394320 RepID=UPI0039FCCE0A
MNQLQEQAFPFAGQNLRIVVIDEEPHFILKDVCEILDLGHVATVKRRLTDDVVSNHPIQDRLGREQTVTVVNEDGLYDVILDSRKPEARQFRKWITSEVIPSIRRNGAYATPQTVENMLNDPEFGIRLLTTLKKEREERHQVEQKRQVEMPFTNFGKAISNSSGSINIGVYAKIIYKDHGVKIGRNNLFKWFRDNGYFIRFGREKNNPKQQYIEQGLFEVTPTLVSRSVGDIETYTTQITGKGQVKFLQVLIKEFCYQKQ